MNQIAEDHKAKFPRAAHCLRNQSYVDNIFGADTIEEAKKTVQELQIVSEKAKIPLAQWDSRDQEILEGLVPPEKLISSLIDPDQETIKTLGLYWNPKRDTFEYQIHWNTSNYPTKRSVLADISRGFDPFGFFIAGKNVE